MLFTTSPPSLREVRQKSKEKGKGEKKETEKKGRPGQDFRKQVRRQEENGKAKRWLPGL